MCTVDDSEHGGISGRFTSSVLIYKVPPHQQTRPDAPDLVELQQQPLGLLMIPTVFIINLETAPLEEPETGLR